MRGRSACLALCVAVGAIALCVTATSTRRQHIDTALHQHVPSARLSALLKRHAAPKAMVSHTPAQPPAHLGDTGRMTTCVTCEGLPRAECKYQKCTTKDGFRGGCVWTGSKGCTCLTEKQARMDKGQCLDDDECTNKGQFCYHHVHNQEFLHTQTIGKGGGRPLGRRVRQEICLVEGAPLRHRPQVQEKDLDRMGGRPYRGNGSRLPQA